MGPQGCPTGRPFFIVLGCLGAGCHNGAMPLKLMIVLSALILLTVGPARADVCTPTAATLCVGVDDYADVWINGHCVVLCAGTDFGYVDSTSASPVACV